MTNLKPILITGAAGFIGARFAESCVSLGYKIISVDDCAHFNNRPEHLGIDCGLIVDREKLFEFLESQKPPLGAIVHMGACTDTAQMDAQYLKRVNLDYSKKIWTYASQNKIPLVYASSAATYGDGALGFNDDESLIPNLKPLNPYGQSKQDFDLWVLDQKRAGTTPPAWCGFKFFNVYGFGERHKEKMASVALHAFDQIMAGGRTRLFKSHKKGIPDGHQKRDFIYIDDVVEVLHFALAKPIKRGIYNLGSGQARTFLDLVTPVFKGLDKPVQIDFIDTPPAIRPRYQYFTEAKMEKLRDQGCAKAFTALEKGVADYTQCLIRVASPPKNK
ncbi:MAG: ADP-glyceromanno-heptose 6-epimerase [Elusimicrobia bacterium]|nr:ADP-glyceromanno-heptose 6-epimerase [Elusimicrobiota bacterium]